MITYFTHDGTTYTFIKGFIGTWILLQASMSISFGTVKTILIYSG